ncbi:ABC transporter substrate-binding protein [Paracoccus suum]|uniref:ABC transporter substrate-binding protein n=1 Tax=Paracoccus suum TaxID=2259340 RepID=A0A344PMZ3_9RHOB|nr:ABC transporter substrate-binding protein [Paracoccus suum]AXC50748.1 ABC transporter substrate-binding protein [Paracoccus suum]
MIRTGSAIGFWAALTVGASTFAPAALARDGEVKIGFAVAQSGWMQAYDEGATNAAIMAMDEINAKGGLLGKKLVPEIRDTRTDVARTAQVAQELLSMDVPMMLVSCDFDLGAPAALAAESAGKISIFLCAADFKAGAQGIGPHSYSAASVGNTEGATIAEWAYSKFNMRKPFTLLDVTIQYDRGLCSGFEWMAPQLEGVQIVGADTFENGDTSIAAQISRIKAANPDAIMLCSYMPGAASAMRQIRAAGITVPILAGTSMDGEDWISSAPGLSGFYGLARGSIRGDDPNPAVNEFVKKYAARFGAAPVSQSTFDGYVAIELWAKAVEKAGTFDADAVVKVMDSFKDEPTLLGPRTFTPDFHIQTQIPFLVTEVSDGKSKVIDTAKLSKVIPLEVFMQQ